MHKNWGHPRSQAQIQETKIYYQAPLELGYFDLQKELGVLHIRIFLILSILC